MLRRRQMSERACDGGLRSGSEGVLRVAFGWPYVRLGAHYAGAMIVQLSMDGIGRALDNVFVERLWRSVKYEKVYLKEYGSLREGTQSLGQYFSSTIGSVPIRP